VLVAALLGLHCLITGNVSGSDANAADEQPDAPLSGSISMKDTGQGVPQVIVTAIWLQRGAWGTTRCLHVESAITDPSGRYTMTGWGTPWPSSGKQTKNVELRIEPYAEGLETVSGNKGDMNLVKFRADRKARLDYLGRFANRVSCEVPAEEQKLLPVLEAVRDEAAKLTVDVDDKMLFAAIQRSVDDIRLGRKESDRLYRQRLEKASPKHPPQLERAR